jgi:hypothetical protein
LEDCCFSRRRTSTCESTKKSCRDSTILMEKHSVVVKSNPLFCPRKGKPIIEAIGTMQGVSQLVQSPFLSRHTTYDCYNHAHLNIQPQARNFQHLLVEQGNNPFRSEIFMKRCLLSQRKQSPLLQKPSPPTPASPPKWTNMKASLFSDALET